MGRPWSAEKDLRQGPTITATDMIDRKAVIFLFIVIMAAFAAIGIILALAG